MFLNINNKVNITLCGMMGSGKSFIGKIIANKIKYDFVDIDRLIEQKEKKTITTIFQENGENYFRNLEEDITIKSLQKENTVISLGGGSIVNNPAISTDGKVKVAYCHDPEGVLLEIVELVNNEQ